MSSIQKFQLREKGTLGDLLSFPDGKQTELFSLHTFRVTKYVIMLARETSGRIVRPSAILFRRALLGGNINSSWATVTLAELILYEDFAACAVRCFLCCQDQ